jgi:hypothetical protein
VHPLKSVIELQDLRNSIAHGRAERFEDTVDHDDIDESMPSLPNSEIRSMVLPKGRLDEVLGAPYGRSWIDASRRGGSR